MDELLDLLEIPSMAKPFTAAMDKKQDQKLIRKELKKIKSGGKSSSSKKMTRGKY